MTSGGEIDHVTFPRALIGATYKLMKLVVLSISFMVILVVDALFTSFGGVTRWIWRFLEGTNL